jgi:hypothetical protein
MSSDGAIAGEAEMKSLPSSPFMRRDDSSFDR